MNVLHTGSISDEEVKNYSFIFPDFFSIYPIVNKKIYRNFQKFSYILEIIMKKIRLLLLSLILVISCAEKNDDKLKELQSEDFKNRVADKIAKKIPLIRKLQISILSFVWKILI